jgi:LL-diaminopimelate aminotransferase
MAFQPADRLAALPPYLFVEIDRKKRAAIAAGKDVITFGVGDPDRPTFSFIIDRLKAAAQQPATHQYPLGIGSQPFREAVAAFFSRRYGVELDPAREILALIGSKEGLGHLPLAVVNPGRTVIVPDPGYPVYHSATLFAGGRPWSLPLRETDDWLPDFDAIPRDIARDAVLIYVNYPNNPTGAVASLDVLERAVAFARDNDVILAQDAAYNEMYFEDPADAPSVLQVPGARDVAVEFHSLSKTYNMTGWRIGFAVGNADVLAALARIKSNLDSGVFTAIQDAGIAALQRADGPEVAAMRRTYRERAAVMAGGLTALGFRVKPPRATFYIWAGVPSGYDALGVVNKLLDEASVVCIPGAGFGREGEGYVRFALTVDIDRVNTALARMRELRW